MLCWHMTSGASDVTCESIRSTAYGGTRYGVDLGLLLSRVSMQGVACGFLYFGAVNCHL